MNIFVVMSCHLLLVRHYSNCSLLSKFIDGVNRVTHFSIILLFDSQFTSRAWNSNFRWDDRFISINEHNGVLLVKVLVVVRQVYRSPRKLSVHPPLLFFNLNFSMFMTVAQPFDCRYLGVEKVNLIFHSFKSLEFLSRWIVVHCK